VIQGGPSAPPAAPPLASLFPPTAGFASEKSRLKLDGDDAYSYLS